jgi:hypothetical protein
MRKGSLLGWTAGMLLFSAMGKTHAQTLPMTLHLESTKIDRLGTGNKGKLTPDGTKDSVFTVRFPAGTGAHAITKLDLTGPGTHWDTDPATAAWTLGVAADPLADLVNQTDGSLKDFTVPDGGSFVLLVTGNVGSAFNFDYALTATLADGNTLQTTMRNDLGIIAILEGETADVLGIGNKAKLVPDGKKDGVISVLFPARSEEHTITNMELRGTNGTFWDTDPLTNGWTLGLAKMVSDALVNNTDGSLPGYTVPSGGAFALIAPDSGPNVAIKPNVAYTLYLTFADGTLPAVKLNPRGDINADNLVNILDATASLRFAVGTLTPTDKQKLVGDMNGDGKLNIQDTTKILRQAVFG